MWPTAGYEDGPHDRRRRRSPTARLATALALWLVLAAALGAAPASATSVSQTSITTSTTAAGATGVTYDIGFNTTSGQLAFPDTITLTGPPGSFTGASFSVVDVTQGNRNLGAGVLSNDGTTAVLRIGSSTPTAAGDRLVVTVTNATNSAAGSHTINVSTSDDVDPVPTPTYNLTTPQALTQSSITTSTSAAGATGVTYDIDFKTSSTGQLLFPGTVTLTAPAGTFANASFNVVDVTQGNRNLGAGVLSNDGTTAVLRIGSSTPTGAGDVLRVTVTNATNPGVGSAAIGIDTSSDTSTTTPLFNLTTQQPLTSPSISVSTTAAGATGVTYEVGFTTSSTGQLLFPGTITLTGPAGTFANASFNVVDVTQGNRNLGAGVLSNDGTTAVLRIGSSTPTGAGDVLRVTVTNATNAGAGSHTIGIDTSSDTPTTTPAYNLTTPQALTGPTISTSTTAAGATGVTYEVTFTTSSTGQLLFPGTITLTAPAGTFTDASFNVIDVTQGNRNLGAGVVSNNGTTAVLRIGSSTPTGAGDVLRVTVTNATNAAAGSHTIGIDTSSDTPTTTPAYNLTAPQAVSGVSVVPSPTTPGATNVTYVINFTTSSTGQLLFPGTITLTAPAGTFTGASFNVVDVTQNNRNLGVGVLSNNGTTAVLRIGSSTTTAAGDVLRVTVTNANNPAAAGPHTIDVRTSSDTTTVTSPPYNLGADTLPPDTTIVAGPSGPTTDTTPTFSFSSNEQGSTFRCQVDNGPIAPCSSPFTVGPLAPGPHTFRVFAVDAANNADETPATRPFTVTVTTPPPVDRTPPDTTIVSGPTGSTSDPTPTFEFRSNEPGSTFQCSIDKGAFFPCASPFTTPALSPGAHTFEVRAIDPAGNVDTSPAGTFSTTAAVRVFSVAAVAPPVLARSVNVVPVKGQVFVSVPAGSARARASQSVPGLKGRRFVPLSEAKQVPVGSLLDTRKGTVRLTSARDASGGTQTSTFNSGVFQVLQSRRRSARGLTELRLKGSSFRTCNARAGRAQAAATRRSKRRVRRLRGNGSGRFRTRGRYSAATVRGTDWTVTDRCDGTLTQVRRGSVTVRDFRRRKNVVVRRGKSYLARARR